MGPGVRRDDVKFVSRALDFKFQNANSTRIRDLAARCARVFAVNVLPF
jgi:hypothetical protein